jgi:hypothetical protein
MSTIEEQIAELLSSKKTYNDYMNQWQYLLESYMGGSEYRTGAHLTRYVNETQSEYVARLRATPLDNHCASVVQVYNSFLFRTEPQRELGSLEANPDAEAFLRDADLDGRSLDAFMKDVSTWASVFGHCWIVVGKPSIGAVTRAEELAQGVRPYLGLVTPLVVLDWSWQRAPNGSYQLVYIKYIEEINDSQRTVKKWTLDTIQTTTVDIDKRLIQSDITEVNGLGYIPMVCVYSTRSPVRGIGVSDITDIADAQRMLYNINSEIEQSIRIDSHPSLVKTPETQAGIGAGSIIHMPDNLDPGLKPYILDYNGAEISAMLSVKSDIVSVIDKMANTGAVRATESRVMSGVAMETEFQLLNARLSEKADNLELAEEQMWSIFANYQGLVWDGTIDYPGSFSIRDIAKEFDQLQTAKSAATDPAVLRCIDRDILKAMGRDDDYIEALLGAAPDSDSVSSNSTQTHPDLSAASVAERQEHIQEMLMSGMTNQAILAMHPELTLDDIVAAGAAAAANN